MKTRKEFLEAVMKRANLKDLKQADDAARAVISLTKLKKIKIFITSKTME